MFPSGVNPNLRGTNPGWPLGINPQALVALILIRCITFTLLPGPSVSLDWLVAGVAISYPISDLVNLQFLASSVEVSVDDVNAC